MLALLLINLFTFVELNCENLFDYMHDIGKEDTEFTPDGSYHWTKSRYWKKLDRTGQTILSCADSASLSIPDMAVLCEVENDTVLHDLTCRSLLRGARYEYVMTSSPDRRGIDVALLYSPFTFRLLSSHAVRVDTIKGMRPRRGGKRRHPACHRGTFSKPSRWRESIAPIPLASSQAVGRDGRLNI